MKYMALLVFVSSFFLNSIAKAQLYDERETIRNGFPKTEEILTHLNNHIRYLCRDGYFQVAKKRDGFYLVVNKKIAGEFQDPLFIQIWSLKKGDYVENDYKKYLTPNRPIEGSHPDFTRAARNQKKMDFFYVYNYEGWSKDIMDIISQYPNKSNQDLEMMARAKSYDANVLIRAEDFKTEEKLANRELGIGYNKMPFDRRDSYIDLTKESISYWEELKQRNPRYTPLITSDLDLKIGHEYMHTYFILMSIHESVKAKYFLDKAWYAPARVQSAKNILDACDQRAILISEGDNDTYPLWYVQLKEQYREDVSVINSSLLYSNWYNEMNRKTFMYKSSLDNKSAHYLSNTMVFPTTALESSPFKNWLRKVTEHPSDSTNYELMPSEILMPYQGKSIELIITGKTIPFNQLAILEIISSNPDRKLYVVSPSNFFSYGLGTHFTSRGLIFQLSDLEQAPSCDKETAQIVDKLIKKTGASYFNNLDQGADYELSRICYAIDNLPFPRERQDLVDQLIEYYPYQNAIDRGEFSILESMFTLYESSAPKEAKELKNALIPSALDFIDEISPVDKNFKEEIADLEYIFSIFSGQRVQFELDTSKTLSNEDLLVLKKLKSKVEKLLRSQVVSKQAWTEQRFILMRNKLEAVIKDQ